MKDNVDELERRLNGLMLYLNLEAIYNAAPIEKKEKKAKEVPPEPQA